jgi:hypothetical protein
MGRVAATGAISNDVGVWTGVGGAAAGGGHGWNGVARERRMWIGYSDRVSEEREGRKWCGRVVPYIL